MALKSSLTSATACWTWVAIYDSSSHGPPRIIDDIDFEIVWESESLGERVNKCVVGDVDGDGIIEFITAYKEWNFADTLHIVIYKSTGDNTYELFMDEIFTDAIWSSSVGVSHFMITDIDENGQKELLFTYDGCYFWEFSAPGEYTEYRSNFVFPRAVCDAKITDINQNGIPEFTTAMATVDVPWNPAAFWVCELEGKDTVDFKMNFDIISGFYQWWLTFRIAVGDFDNDGAVDIVQGNAYIMSPGHAPDVIFYRYNPSSYTLFDLYYLEAGMVVGCNIPIMEDFDSDGDLDLYVGGPTYGGGAAYLWEGTGLLNGYVSWYDISSAATCPDYSYLGFINNNFIIVASCTPYMPPVNTSMLYLWTWNGSGFDFAWESDYIYSAYYRQPHLADMDGDGKISILLVDDDNNKMIDWEQTSVGVWDQPEENHPNHFTLSPVFPNPFNPTAIIPFELPQMSDIQLSVYDITGRIVYELHQENVPLGQNTIEWNAVGQASGIYFVKLVAGKHQSVQKLVLMK